MEQKKFPPKWWSKVISDIEKIVASSGPLFQTPKTIIDIPRDEEDNIIGVVVRLENGGAGFYPASKKISPKVGYAIKNKLPDPAVEVKEPDFSRFVYELIRERIRLVPPIWLYKIIKKMTSNKAITKDDLKPFPEWVLLSPENKKDKQLVDLLYRAASYEGLKGLERFNDKAI